MPINQRYINKSGQDIYLLGDVRIRKDVAELKRNIEGKCDGYSIKSDARKIIEKNYENILHPDTTTITEFFYPLLVQVFYIERKERNPETINYLTDILSSRFVSMTNIPTTRREFTAYMYHQNVGVEKRTLTHEQFGALALFNSGILFVYNQGARKVLNQEYFREMGKAAYQNASIDATNTTLKELYSWISHSFMFYEDGLRDMSARFIFGGQGEMIVNELIDKESLVKNSPTEENILAKGRIQKIFIEGSDRTNKYQELRTRYG